MKTSLDHLPEYKQRELATISEILRDCVEAFVSEKTGRRSSYRIVKIILFGSHAKGSWVKDVPNGYISDYDILVIVNDDSLVEEDAIWHRAKDQIELKVKSAPLGLIVHSLHEVNSLLKEGFFFFKDIREEGVELFSSSSKPLKEPGNLTVEERRAIAQKHFDIWFESSQQFLVLSQDCIKREWLKQAAFQLHQATEKSFACTLLVCTNYIPKSHDIEKLGKLCAQIDPEFANIFPLDSKFHRRSFRRLQRAYIDSRYSEHYEITQEELEYLEGQVLRLQALVETVCKEKMG